MAYRNVYLKKSNNNFAYNTDSSFYSVVIFFIIGFYYLLLSSALMNFSFQDAAGQTTVPRNFLLYENPAYGFKIKYPAGWEKTEFSGDIEEGHRKIIVNFISPLESASDTFREYLIIEIGMLGSQAALSFQYAINTYLASLKSLPNFKLIESSILSVADSPAQKLVYSYSNPEVGVTKTIDVLVAKNEKLYLLSFNSDAHKYNVYLPTIQEMINSLQLG
jgi:eukaryotic-like serine/threonine-protein kinase